MTEYNTFSPVQINVKWKINWNCWKFLQGVTFSHDRTLTIQVESLSLLISAKCHSGLLKCHHQKLYKYLRWVKEIWIGKLLSWTVWNQGPFFPSLPFLSLSSPPLPSLSPLHLFSSSPSLFQVLSKSFSHSLHLHSPKQTEYLGRNGVGTENLRRKDIRWHLSDRNTQITQ